MPFRLKPDFTLSSYYCYRTIVLLMRFYCGGGKCRSTTSERFFFRRISLTISDSNVFVPTCDGIKLYHIDKRRRGRGWRRVKAYLHRDNCRRSVYERNRRITLTNRRRRWWVADVRLDYLNHPQTVGERSAYYIIVSHFPDCTCCTFAITNVPGEHVHAAVWSAVIFLRYLNSIQMDRSVLCCCSTRDFNGNRLKL